MNRSTFIDIKEHYCDLLEHQIQCEEVQITAQNEYQTCMRKRKEAETTLKTLIHTQMLLEGYEPQDVEAVTGAQRYLDLTIKAETAADLHQVKTTAKHKCAKDAVENNICCSEKRKWTFLQ
jgi:hypothetical protein